MQRPTELETLSIVLLFLNRCQVIRDQWISCWILGQILTLYYDKTHIESSTRRRSNCSHTENLVAVVRLNRLACWFSLLPCLVSAPKFLHMVSSAHEQLIDLRVLHGEKTWSCFGWGGRSIRNSYPAVSVMPKSAFLCRVARSVVSGAG